MGSEWEIHIFAERFRSDMTAAGAERAQHDP
jgi:hypothetical protein